MKKIISMATLILLIITSLGITGHASYGGDYTKFHTKVLEQDRNGNKVLIDIEVVHDGTTNKPLFIENTTLYRVGVVTFFQPEYELLNTQFIDFGNGYYRDCYGYMFFSGLKGVYAKIYCLEKGSSAFTPGSSYHKRKTYMFSIK